MMFRAHLTGLALLAAALLANGVARANADAPVVPVVIELFTSQGCSSCPPADAFLGELVTDKTLLPLSIHVDYWDYIGWKDPFADPAHTARQKEYMRRFATRYIYTPQTVIDGRFEEVGSKKRAIRKRIAEARRQIKLDVKLTIETGRARISIAPDRRFTGTPATVWLVAFDGRHDTSIRRGENGGRTLSYFNVVRALNPIARWQGAAFERTVPLPAPPRDGQGPQGIAVIVQQDGTGPVIGAAQIRPENR